MATRIIALLCVVFTAGGAFAQTTTQPSDTKTSVGIVNGSSVLVRSAPGRDAYFVLKLNIGDKVTIIGKNGEWLQIVPPLGTFCVVDKKYVQSDATGGGATITGDNVNTHLGGQERKSDFFALGKQLKKGDKVQVLGAIGDWVQITPPAGNSFWISAQYVAPEGTSVGFTTTTRPAPTMGGTVAISGTVRVIKQPTTQPLPDINNNGNNTTVISGEAMANLRSELELFQAVDKELIAMAGKPADQQDLAGMIVKYKAINLAPDSKLKPFADNRIAYLQSIIDRNASLKTAQTIVTEVETNLSAFTVKPVDIVNVPTVKSYAAQGVLTTSSMFPGGANGIPRRWILRDPVNQRMDAFVQCTTGKVDLDKFVGKYVGVHGTTTVEKGLGSILVEATEDPELLQGDVKLPDVPQPVIRAKETPAKPIVILVKEPEKPAAPAPEVTPILPPEVKAAPKVEPKTEPKPLPAPTTTPAAATVELNLDPLPAVAPTTQPVKETDY